MFKKKKASVKDMKVLVEAQSIIIINYYAAPRKDMVAQLVERRPQDQMDSKTRGSNPVRSTRKICETFSESKMLC